MFLLLACHHDDPAPDKTPETVSDSAPDSMEETTETEDTGLPEGLSGVPPETPAALPQFSATNSDGGNRYPTNLTGSPTILSFYPDLDSGSSLTEILAFEDRVEDFDIVHVRVLAVSFQSPTVSAELVDKRRISYELWTDDNKALALAYGAISSADEAAPHRRSVLLDGDGTLVLVYDPVNVVNVAELSLADSRAIFNR